MKKPFFTGIICLMGFILFGCYGYGYSPEKPFNISEPKLVHNNSLNQGVMKDDTDELCIVGHGADLEVEPNKQKAFVAAFCDALRNLIQIKNGIQTPPTNEKTGSTSIIEIASKGRIGNFEVTSNTKMEDLTLIEDKVIVKYNKLIITTINSVLVSPAIENIDFIQGGTPQEVGGMKVNDVTFDSNGICEVQLSFKDQAR